MRMTVSEITAACSGTLLCGSGDTVVTSVSTDSRKVEPGTLFVPIKGERVDAHAFIPTVFAAGAAATLTENSETYGEHAAIAVPDTKAALQAIAAAYRKKFSIPVIGITGSVGKSSTKEMVAAALSATKNVLKTEGNFNSQIGLPLTVFRLEPEHTAAVIEMGMSEFGEMSRLASVAAPNRAVVTNIGISHIELLKTQQNIRSEKLHITDAFPEDGVLFLNGDDPLLAEKKGTLPFRTFFFGKEEHCDYRAEDMTTDGENTQFTLVRAGERISISIPAIGEHNVYNALAAVAVAESIGVSIEDAKSGLLQYKGLAMRQQIHKLKDITVVDDSYNASPDSMKSGINVLKSLPVRGKTVAVLADMLELGEHSAAAHYACGKYAAEQGVAAVVAIGGRAKEIAHGARENNPKAVVKECENNAEALRVLSELLTPGDVVLVKGSRGMHTDQIVKALLEKYV